MKQLAITILRWYQRTRILRVPICRFYPSCSSYACQAIDRHGLMKGLILLTLRLLRCHPLHPGGVDEVPDQFGLRLNVRGRTAEAVPRLDGSL